MNRYTIKTSKKKAFYAYVLNAINFLIKASYKALIRMSRHMYHLSKKVKEKASKASETSKGITFSITAATLLDSRILRFRIQVLNGKKYYAYYMGEYKEKYKEYGKDVAIEDQHYYLASSLYNEWKEV